MGGRRELSVPFSAITEVGASMFKIKRCRVECVELRFLSAEDNKIVRTLTLSHQLHEIPNTPPVTCFYFTWGYNQR